MAAGERYVLVGLARARPRWFVDLAQWTTSYAVPADLEKAATVEEVAARLRSGRRFSAVLVGTSVSGWDRDLAGLAASNGCAVILVEDRLSPPSGSPSDEGPQSPVGPDRSLADAVLPVPLDRDHLVRVLEQVAQRVARASDAPDVGVAAPLDAAGSPEGVHPWRARLVAVTGAGGTGKSTLAMALARGLASDPRDRRHVVLADLALRAQQSVLHDSGDVLPGLPELIEAHRHRRLGADGVRNLCFEVPDGGYDLLLGLRHRREWAACRAFSAGAALDGLRSTYRLVVADVDPDVEGEGPTGSVDVEERNHLARLSLAQADLVLVTGRAGVTGVHAQVELLSELLAYGVAPERILPVVNRAPRRPGRRAEIRSALAAHTSERLRGARFAANPYFVNERRGLDDLLAGGGAVPAQVSSPLARTVRVLLDRALLQVPFAPSDSNRSPAEPVRVEPGSVGRWTDELTGDIER